jgi:hypothetical protein
LLVNSAGVHCNFYQLPSALQPANINYMTLKAAEALKRLTAIEQELPNPNN